MPPAISNHPHQHPSLLAEYFAFVKTPTYEQAPRSPLKTLTTICRLFAFHFVVVYIPAIILISTLSKWISAIEDNKLGTLIEEMPLGRLFLMAVLLVPLLEELLFRLPLRFSTRNLTISITILLLMGGSQILQVRGTQSGPESWIFLLTVVLGSFISTQILGRINRRRGEQFFARHLFWLIYGSSILFGLVHISNYPQAAWIVGPILVLPQITVGMLFAYARIKFGFIWAFFAHGLNNFLVMTPLLFIALGSEQLQAQLQEDVDITELLPRDQLILGVAGLWGLVILVIMLAVTIQLILAWRKSQQSAA